MYFEENKQDKVLKNYEKERQSILIGIIEEFKEFEEFLSKLNKFHLVTKKEIKWRKIAVNCNYSYSCSS